MWRNSKQQWGLVSRILHWLVVLVILVELILGLCADSWKLSPMKLDLFVWHKSVGMLILLLVILRLLWRLANVTPELLSATAFERLAARGVQAAMYALMILLPLSGWVITSAAHIPVKLFWLVPLPPLVEPDKGLKLLAEDVHGSCLIIFCVLVALHVGAALKHHVVLRNDILKRMWLW